RARASRRPVRGPLARGRRLPADLEERPEPVPRRRLPGPLPPAPERRPRRRLAPHLPRPRPPRRDHALTRSASGWHPYAVGSPPAAAPRASTSDSACPPTQRRTLPTILLTSCAAACP